MSNNKHKKNPYPPRQTKAEQDNYQKFKRRDNAPANNALAVLAGIYDPRIKDNTGFKLYKGVDTWEGDGVDHINVNLVADTELGRMLSMDFKHWFNDPLFERFLTLKNAWLYIRSEERPEELRSAVGYGQREIEKAITNRKMLHIRAIVMDIAYKRIKANDKLYRLMYDNELPFDSYMYTKSGLPKRHDYHEWFVPGYAAIQTAIQQDKEPSFAFLCDGPTEDIYESVRPKARPKFEHKPKEHLSNKPAPKESPKKSVKEDRPERRDYTEMLYKRSEEYSFTDFPKDKTIHGILYGSFPLLTEKLIPLDQLTVNDDLDRRELYHDEDVIGANPMAYKAFYKTPRTASLLQLEDIFILSDADPRKVIVIPMNLDIMDRPHERAHDVQISEDTTGACEKHYSRKLRFYRKLEQLAPVEVLSKTFSEDGQIPSYGKNEARYAYFEVSFNVAATLGPIKGSKLCFDGSIRLLGYTDTNSDVGAPPEDLAQEAPGRSVVIHAFLPRLYRGIAKEDPVRHQQNPTSEEQNAGATPAVEEVSGEPVSEVEEVQTEEHPVDEVVQEPTPEDGEAISDNDSGDEQQEEQPQQDRGLVAQIDNSI